MKVSDIIKTDHFELDYDDDLYDIYAPSDSSNIFLADGNFFREISSIIVERNGDIVISYVDEGFEADVYHQDVDLPFLSAQFTAIE